jgi:malate synthase
MGNELMHMNQVKKGNLIISSVLLNFVNQEVIPGTGIDAEDFWKKFDLAVHELAPANKTLIEKR